MKKIVQINVTCNGSTGKIMCDIHKEAVVRGFISYCFYGRGKDNSDSSFYKIGNKLSIFFHLFLARLGFNGRGSFFATKKLIKRIKEINPDVIHLHNIHGYYLNIKELFNYLKYEYNGKILWTLHDCWAFTGHCAYFTMIGCNKWKGKCHHCPQLSSYPKELVDTTKIEFFLKKETFTDIKNITLITPSNWLKDLVKKSFLSDYKVSVINNGIDLNVFKPTKNNAIYEKYSIPKDKKIILGVANIWEERKGFSIFLELAKIISNEYVITLIGLTDTQIKSVPDNVIGIKRTDNQEELASIYTIADVFINPSQEETFSLVTAEAMACGTPVVVCGKSAPKELINDSVGRVVNENKASEYFKVYEELMNKKVNRNYITEYAKRFSKDNMDEQYMKLYEE